MAAAAVYCNRVGGRISHGHVELLAMYNVNVWPDNTIGNKLNIKM